MSIDRGMDKEDVVHIYNGILLSHKKKRNFAIFRDMDRPRDCYIEWSQKEKNKYLTYQLYVESRKMIHTDEPVCKAEIETQM